MIFYEKKNLPRVWSGKNKGRPIIFSKGVFETDNPKLIDALVKAGYPHEELDIKKSVKRKSRHSKPSKLVFPMEDGNE